MKLTKAAAVAVWQRDKAAHKYGDPDRVASYLAGLWVGRGETDWAHVVWARKGTSDRAVIRSLAAGFAPRPSSLEDLARG